MKVEIERRKHTRMEPNRTIAVGVVVDSYSKSGVLVDISVGGLAFRYINEDGASTVEDQKLCTFSLVDTGGRVLLENITASVVCDRLAPEEYSFSSLIMRKIGLEFNELPHDHAKRLELLLRSFSPQTKNPPQVYLPSAHEFEQVKF